MSYFNFLLIYSAIIFLIVFILVFVLSVLFGNGIVRRRFERIIASVLLALIISYSTTFLSKPFIAPLYSKVNKNAYIKVKTEKLKVIDKYSKRKRYKTKTKTKYYLIVDVNGDYQDFKVSKSFWNKTTVGDFINIEIKQIYDSKELVDEFTKIK